MSNRIATHGPTQIIPRTDAGTFNSLVGARVIRTTPYGELYWVLCPQCAARLRYIRREYNHTCKDFGKCDHCGYGSWLPDIDREVRAFLKRLRSGSPALVPAMAVAR